MEKKYFLKNENSKKYLSKKEIEIDSSKILKRMEKVKYESFIANTQEEKK